ncbi:MAG: hypothetical protein HQL51_00010 [Magnetococcales bacterium]|nr:hypothetical protein [Magnetococcales bacterium]
MTMLIPLSDEEIQVRKNGILQALLNCGVPPANCDDISNYYNDLASIVLNRRLLRSYNLKMVSIVGEYESQLKVLCSGACKSFLDHYAGTPAFSGGVGAQGSLIKKAEFYRNAQTLGKQFGDVATRIESEIKAGLTAMLQKIALAAIPGISGDEAELVAVNVMHDIQTKVWYSAWTGEQLESIDVARRQWRGVCEACEPKPCESYCREILAMAIDLIMELLRKGQLLEESVNMLQRAEISAWLGAATAAHQSGRHRSAGC